MFVVKSLLFASMFTASAAVAAELPLDVTAAPSDSQARAASIRFVTKEIHSSMCHLTTLAVTVKAPEPRQGAGIPLPPVGLVAFTAALKAETLCATAFGPHNGGIDLRLGRSLPELAPGYYALNINDANYGVIAVGADDSVKLIDWSDLPQ